MIDACSATIAARQNDANGDRIAAFTVDGIGTSATRIVVCGMVSGECSAVDDEFAWDEDNTSERNEDDCTGAGETDTANAACPKSSRLSPVCLARFLSRFERVLPLLEGARVTSSASADANRFLVRASTAVDFSSVRDATPSLRTGIPVAAADDADGADDRWKVLGNGESVSAIDASPPSSITSAAACPPRFASMPVSRAMPFLVAAVGASADDFRPTVKLFSTNSTSRLTTIASPTRIR